MHLVKALIVAGAIMAGGGVLGSTAHADDFTDGMRTVTTDAPTVTSSLIAETPAIDMVASDLRTITGLPTVPTDTGGVNVGDTTATSDGLRSVTFAP